MMIFGCVARSFVRSFVDSLDGVEGWGGGGRKKFYT